MPATLNTGIQEEKRLLLQGELDKVKSLAERNRMGQFATPGALAHDMLLQAKQYLPSADPVRFLDPAIGTGAFFSALQQVFPLDRIADARGYEIDPHYGVPAMELWCESVLDLRLEDFTEVLPESIAKFDLIVCNPPYVRHHHLQNKQKTRLRACAQESSGLEVSGLAGLYCYFMLLSHQWMERSAIAGWLIPSEFMNVNYGDVIKNYLLNRVTLLRIHRFNPIDVQFGDALVSSAVVWFRNEKPNADYQVKMSFGGDLLCPQLERSISSSELRDAHKWSQFPGKSPKRSASMPRLSDFFQVKRGLVTGSNKFFILDEEEIHNRELPSGMFRPILPGPRNLEVDEILCDNAQNPILEKKLFLLDCKLSREEIRRTYPSLWSYLEQGQKDGVADKYICRHRTPWYSQETRHPAPFVCTYLGRVANNREKPFRFILNRSNAIAANVYLMLYPKTAVADAIARDPALLERTWYALNSISTEALLGEGRVYGGGLHKLEPKELANVPVATLDDLYPRASSDVSQEEVVSING